MKKTLEYSVWIAIVAVIAIVTYQWRWFSPLSINNIVAVESTTTPQQSAIYSTHKPSWSVELATNTLAISENSQYSLPLNIYDEISRFCLWCSYYYIITFWKTICINNVNDKIGAAKLLLAITQNVDLKLSAVYT